MFSLLLTNMKSKILLLLPLAFCVLTACQNQGCNHQYDEYYVTSDSDWYTYIVGSDFDSTGLEVRKKCAKCGHLEKAEFTLEDDKNLALDQESVGIIVKDKPIVTIRENNNVITPILYSRALFSQSPDVIRESLVIIDGIHSFLCHSSYGNGNSIVLIITPPSLSKKNQRSAR